jgi:hypothetical protein
MADKNSKEYKERYGVIENEKGELETEFKTVIDENGQVKQKKRSKIKSGRLSRAAGARFELKVRKYWEDKGFIIEKWSNNIDLQNSKLIPAKRKYNPFKKALSIGTGFPDFIAIQFIKKGFYDVFGVEVKMNGILSKEEKDKCKWYLNNNVFSKILVAKKSDNRGEIEYMDFSERWGAKL